MIKYGVVSIDKLCRDLIDWETLYVAGRMHKPVKILRDDARVRLANQVNLTEAVRVALLTLPEKFNEEQLFEKIAGISYVGDFRMTVGENPNKVRNIVQAQLDHFNRLYYSLLDDLPNVAVLSHGQFQVMQKRAMALAADELTWFLELVLAKPEPQVPWSYGAKATKDFIWSSVTSTSNACFAQQAPSSFEQVWNVSTNRRFFWFAQIYGSM